MAISSDQKEEVLSIIEDQISNKNAFTAYTITNRAKQAGIVFDRHQDIREIVREAWNNTILDYERSYVTLSNNLKTVLYHPNNLSPDETSGFMVRKDDTNDSTAINI